LEEAKECIVIAESWRAFWPIRATGRERGDSVYKYLYQKMIFNQA